MHASSHFRAAYPTASRNFRQRVDCATFVRSPASEKGPAEAGPYAHLAATSERVEVDKAMYRVDAVGKESDDVAFIVDAVDESALHAEHGGL